MSRVVALLGVLGLSACGNPCQQVCPAMADYARECGLSVSEGDILTCKAQYQGGVSDETLDVCREFSDPSKMREWWTCDDVAANMTGAE